MKSWMRWARDLTSAAFRRPRARVSDRRKSRAGGTLTGAPEGLERREVMSITGLGSFASLPVNISSPTAPSRVTFQFPAGEISSVAGKPLFLGFNVQAAVGSATAPQITRVAGPAGGVRSRARETGGEVFITRVGIPADKPAAFAVDVLAINNLIGNANVKAFLPGDVNGDGTVDSQDIAPIKAAYGSHEGQARYNAAADFNGDGKVGCVDLTLAKKNLGDHITLPAPAPAITPTPAPAPVVAQPAPQPVQVAFAPAPTPVQQVAVAPVQTAVTPVQTVAVAQTQPVAVTQVQAAPATQTVLLAPASVSSTTVAPFNGQVLYTPVQNQAVVSNVVGTQAVASTPVYYQAVAASNLQGVSSTPVYYQGSATNAAYQSIPTTPVYYQLANTSTQAQATSNPGQLYVLTPVQGTSAAKN